MERVLEPELMESEEQSEAYAQADFSESNERFVELFCARFGELKAGEEMLDLGCGDGDIAMRLARRLTGARITGVDGSGAMLAHARRRIAAETGLAPRVRFLQETIPVLSFPKRSFAAVMSNSLLHHLPRPGVLWDAVRAFGRAGSAVFVMDLIRPESPEAADSIVAKYAAGAPEVLRRDFGNSLRAAFTLPEVREQLNAAGLGHLEARQASDRHWIVSGRIA